MVPRGSPVAVMADDLVRRIANDTGEGRAGPMAERRRPGRSGKKAASQLFASRIHVYAGEWLREPLEPESLSDEERDIMATGVDHAAEISNSLAVLYRAGR